MQRKVTFGPDNLLICECCNARHFRYDHMSFHHKLFMHFLSAILIFRHASAATRGTQNHRRESSPKNWSVTELHHKVSTTSKVYLSPQERLERNSYLNVRNFWPGLYCGVPGSPFLSKTGPVWSVKGPWSLVTAQSQGRSWETPSCWHATICIL